MDFNSQPQLGDCNRRISGCHQQVTNISTLGGFFSTPPRFASEKGGTIQYIQSYDDWPGYPQIIHFNRGFHYFHHPFWGTPIFGNIHVAKSHPTGWDRMAFSFGFGFAFGPFWFHQFFRLHWKCRSFSWNIGQYAHTHRIAWDWKIRLGIYRWNVPFMYYITCTMHGSRGKEALCKLSKKICIETFTKNRTANGSISSLYPKRFVKFGPLHSFILVIKLTSDLSIVDSR